MIRHDGAVGEHSAVGLKIDREGLLDETEGIMPGMSSENYGEKP